MDGWIYRVHSKLIKVLQLSSRDRHDNQRVKDSILRHGMDNKNLSDYWIKAIFLVRLQNQKESEIMGECLFLLSEPLSSCLSLRFIILVSLMDLCFRAP